MYSTLVDDLMNSKVLSNLFTNTSNRVHAYFTHLHIPSSGFGILHNPLCGHFYIAYMIEDVIIFSVLSALQLPQSSTRAQIPLLKGEL